VPVTQKRPDVPPALAKIVMKCLEKRPIDRPQSAAEIVRALRTTPPTGTGAIGLAQAGSRLPPWAPWALAGVSTIVAIVLAVMLLLR
jgi:serine/threonine-protein kinase